MQIILRGQKVKTQLVSKSLAYIEHDVYRPKFLVSFDFLVMMSARAVLVVYSPASFPPLLLILILNLSIFALSSVLSYSVINEIEINELKGGRWRVQNCP